MNDIKVNTKLVVKIKVSRFTINQKGKKNVNNICRRFCRHHPPLSISFITGNQGKKKRKTHTPTQTYSQFADNSAYLY